MPMKEPRFPIFISYSHDSEHHRNQVKAFADRLRENGVDAMIDQYVESPIEGWPAWMLKQIKRAKFVLVICTKEYRNRFEGTAKKGRGVGAKFEGAVVTQAIYEEESKTNKFVPVVFKEADISHRPTVLRSKTFYTLQEEEGWSRLYRFLTGQSEAAIPPLGKIHDFSKVQEIEIPTPPKTSPELQASLPSVNSGRLKYQVSISSNAKGLTVSLSLANLSSYPIFVENPQLIIEAKGVEQKSLDQSKAESAVSGVGSSIQLLPMALHKGPLQPTERRNYFIPYESIQFIVEERNRLGGRAYIEVSSGIGEELRLDDNGTINTLRSFFDHQNPSKRMLASNGGYRFDDVSMVKTMRLVDKRLSTEASRAYEVMPPKILSENPQIVESEEVFQKLYGHLFKIGWADGTTDSCTFEELIIMTYELIRVKSELQKFFISATSSQIGAVNLELKTAVNPKEILKNAVAVFKTLELSSRTSD